MLRRPTNPLDFFPGPMQWPVDPRSLLLPGPEVQVPKDSLTLQGPSQHETGVFPEGEGYFMDELKRDRIQPISTFLRLLQGLGR